MLWRRLYVWGCSLAVVLAAPGAAYACIFGADFSIAEVPANGLVQLTWRCHSYYCSSKDVPNPLRIVDTATMAEVPGTVVWSHGEGTMGVNIFWKANEALVAGRSYRVLDLPSYAERTQEFTVLPAATWVKTAELDVQSSLDLTEDFSAGEISCPARYKANFCFPATDRSPKDATFPTRFRTYLWISAYATHATGSVPPLKRRSVYWREGETALELASTPWALDSGTGRIEEGATRYCYRTAVQNLLDGSEREWEGCLEHGALPELGTREASREEIKPGTGRCAEPPAGLEKEWCEQSMIACEYKPPPSDCASVAERCVAPEPEQPADDEDAGAAEDDAPKPRKARAGDAADAGCSAPGGPTGGSPQPLLLLAAIAVWCRKRACP